jgi:hypothetical protein
VATKGCAVVTGVLAVEGGATVVVAFAAGGEEDTVVVVVVVAGTKIGTAAVFGDVAGGVVEDVMMVGGGNACWDSTVDVGTEKPET